MYFSNLDIGTIVLVALIPLLFGSFWYSPAVFGNHWLRLSGLQYKDVRQAHLAIMGAFFGSFLASLAMSFVLGVLINNLIIYSALDGMTVGFLVWLGFVATTTLPEYLFSETKPILLYFLVNGYHLVSLVVMGGLLALWL